MTTQITSMGEYEFIFWLVIAVMCFLTFGIWLADKLIEYNERDYDPRSVLQKQIDKANSDAEEILRKAQIELDKRKRLDGTK